MTTKKRSSWMFLKLLYKLITMPLLPALAGYGLFWWYMQPFSDLREFPTLAIMIACYVAALGGYYAGKN